MEKYLQELDGAAKLVKPDGNMADYYRKRKSLYMEYFYLSELSARMMVDNQRYVDIWEAYERGIVDIQQALQKSKELQDQMKASEPYDSRTFICRGAHLN